MNEARIDKWMWAVRIFKTRTIAAEACKKGRISINGALAKAARTVKPGDVIQVRKPPRHLFLQSSATHRKACRRKVSGRNDGECNDSGTV